MTKNSNSKGNSEKPDKNINLEDVLISLQKSFSRVSQVSRDVPSECSRALIFGNVNFELTIRLEPKNDFLVHRTDGDIQLKLNGVILQDIQEVPLNEESTV